MKKINKLLPIAFLFSIATSYGGEVKISEKFLEKCPNKPNCVLSLEEIKDSSQYIEPLHFEDKNVEMTKEKLKQIIQNMGGVIVEEDDLYIKSNFFSSFFKFKDVTEFIIVPDKSSILVRSGAETGYSDFGINRKRIEKIRESMK
ncbi:MAG: DUF1499 domain-containing protein [Fusobacteriaceae bacterium]